MVMVVHPPALFPPVPFRLFLLLPGKDTPTLFSVLETGAYSDAMRFMIRSRP